MAQASKPRSVKHTSEQDEAISSLTAATGETYADLVRRLLKAEAERYSIAFPMNVPTKSESMLNAQKVRWHKNN